MLKRQFLTQNTSKVFSPPFIQLKSIFASEEETPPHRRIHAHFPEQPAGRMTSVSRKEALWAATSEAPVSLDGASLLCHFSKSTSVRLSRTRLPRDLITIYWFVGAAQSSHIISYEFVHTTLAATGLGRRHKRGATVTWGEAGFCWGALLPDYKKATKIIHISSEIRAPLCHK